MSNFIYDDGGREKAGYRGKAGDCAVRAIAISMQRPYQKVYDGLWGEAEMYAWQHKNKVAQKILSKGPNPRYGVFKEVYSQYIKDWSWVWVSCMTFGSGCKVHLNKEELPGGNLIVRVSKHLVAVIDGVIHDISDCSRDGTRCVYGFWYKPN